MKDQETASRESAPAPRVSIVVATHNAAAFIAPTLRSALDQSYRDTEVIVIDDGSTDATADEVRRVASGDPRVRIIEQENSGLAAARNRGVDEARGEFVAFLDHDDLWAPGKIAEQVAVLDARPEVAVVSCYSALLDEHHNCMGWRYGGDANGDVYTEMREWDMVSGGSVALVRRAALADAGGFDVDVPVRADWDMWIRLARRCAFATIPRVLVGYTRRPGSMSREYESMVEDGVRVLAKVEDSDASFDAAQHRYLLARDLFAVASLCTIDGATGPAWRYLGRSLAITPMAVLRRPRRWALVAMLCARTVLPEASYCRLLDLGSRFLFSLPIGKSFYELRT